MKKKLVFTYISRGMPTYFTVEYRWAWRGIVIPITFARTIMIDPNFTGEYIEHLTKHLLK